ncbi:MFS transporter [Furfurilactobacillus rossiae]|uniref:Major facilitator superfamily permease n=1 Tax=Furfurilactobacillus rossiae DSM 15814 TaxID=1114972 RepID=A0A0R1RHQ6_9LACO|nr:MFS transporter [Furfurilactobacillus rossiae]KRL53781.1 major facilitator superfamily permease [Furfurilactobacillus rossiae DSM 15814]QFR66722.1 MFS transporter [Furfurilactobacillus rossiae]QLE62199.1 permease of the major facilitator [Furfurilactobacillus rossiae]
MKALIQTETSTQTHHFSWPLLSSAIISKLGSILYTFALNWYLIKLTGNASALGTINAVAGVAMVAGNLFSGPVVDQHNRQRLLICSDLLSAVACITVALFINTQRPQIVLLTVMSGILAFVFAFNSPSVKAITPEIIDKDHLPRFNATTNSTSYLIKLVGPALGGLLIGFSFMNLRAFMWLNGWSFVFAAVLDATLRYRFAPNHEKQNFINSLITGFTYLRQTPALLDIIIICAWVNFFYAGLDILLPYLIHHVYQLPAINYSWLLFAQAAGGILCGLWVGKRNREANLRQMFADLVGGSAILGLAGFWTNYWFLLVITFVCEFIMARFNINFFAFVQTHTNREFLGRVFSAVFLTVSCLAPLGSFLFGQIINQIGNFTFLLISLGTIVTALITHLFFREKETK